MREITVRDLRNQGREVLDRVRRGETLTVTRGGRPVAELRPLPRQPAAAVALLETWRNLPAVDPVRFRADIDAIMDAEV
jgi:prevent-host-death family protein